MQLLKTQINSCIFIHTPQLKAFNKITSIFAIILRYNPQYTVPSIQIPNNDT